MTVGTIQFVGGGGSAYASFFNASTDYDVVGSTGHDGGTDALYLVRDKNDDLRSVPTTSPDFTVTALFEMRKVI